MSCERAVAPEEVDAAHVEKVFKTFFPGGPFVFPVPKHVLAKDRYVWEVQSEQGWSAHTFSHDIEMHSAKSKEPFWLKPGKDCGIEDMFKLRAPLLPELVVFMDESSGYIVGSKLTMGPLVRPAYLHSIRRIASTPEASNDEEDNAISPDVGPRRGRPRRSRRSTRRTRDHQALYHNTSPSRIEE